MTHHVFFHNPFIRFIRATTGVHPCSKAGCEPDEECQVDEKGMPQCQCKGPCPPIHRPVCGSDQLTYSSNCELEREACLQKRSIKLLYEGVCGKLATSTIPNYPSHFFWLGFMGSFDILPRY
jgi:hypothetical protein